MGIMSWDFGGGFNSSSWPIQRPCDPLRPATQDAQNTAG